MLRTQLDPLIAKARDRLSPEQVRSVVAMMERVAQADGAPTEPQRVLLQQVDAGLTPPTPGGTWG